MRQKERELITHFPCQQDFVITCSNESGYGQQVNYFRDIVTGQIVAGLVNIESRILVEAATLTTLEQKFKRLVSLKTTDRVTCHFLNSIPPITSFNVQRVDREQWSQGI